MVVEEFRNQEKSYENWCKEHQNGYVFNFAGGRTGNVLHRVGCWHLNVPSRIGTYTTRYPKYCSEDSEKISDKADFLSKHHGWRQCSACFNL